MAVKKLSQIAPAVSAPAATDQLVGVTGGTTDNLYSVTQIGAGLVNAGIIRTILTANTNRYVSITGSDSNGGTNPTTDAWATMQHANDNVSSMLDLGGFLVLVNIGSGTFVGIGIKPVLGGPVEFKGNGVANTFIDNGPNDGVFNQGECIAFYIATFGAFYFNEMTLKPSSGIGNAMLYANVGDGLIVYAEDHGAVAAGHFAFDDSNGTGLQAMNFNGPNLTVADTLLFRNAVTLAGITSLVGADINTDMTMASNHTITGTPAQSGAWVSAHNDSAIICFNPTFTGTTTGGSRFSLQTGSTITSQNLTLFPGATQGIADPSSNYGGSAVPLTVSLLTSNFTAASYPGSRMFVTDSTATLAAGLGNIVAGTGGNQTPVYSDGINWRIG